MSQTEAEAGQVVIDGFPLADRMVGIQGQVTVKPDVYDELVLGSRLRVVLEVDVVSRTDRKKRSEWGDDQVNRVLGVSVWATRSAKVVEVPAEEPTAAANGDGGEE